MKLKMNKLVAVLCLVTMIVSTIVPMFAFTANAAGTTYSYTFESKQFDAAGTKELGGVNWTFAGEGGGYFGFDSQNGKGQQFGSGSKPYTAITLTSDTFSGVSKIVINTSGASSISANFTVSVGGKQVGSSTALTKTATEYTFEPDTQLDGKVQFAYTQTSSKAIYIKSIEITYAGSASACQHTNKVAIGAVEATCTTDGSTAGEKCADCEYVITAPEIIPATGHSYQNGACTACGAEEGALPEVPADPQKYVFSDYPAGTQYAENEKHELKLNNEDEAILTVYTTQAHFTTELRLYSSSTHDGFAILDSKLPMRALAFNAGNKEDTLNVYGSSNGSDWTLIAGVSVTSTSYNDYTVDFGGKAYNYIKLDVAGTQQVRLKNMTVTYTAPGGCTHYNTTYVSYANGTHNFTCDDCGPYTVNAHSFVDGVCVCGVAEYPVYTIPQANAAPDGTKLTLQNVEVVEIKTAYSSQYNNISLIVKDAEGNEFYCFRLNGNWNLGDVITVKGTKTTYDSTVIEFAAGCTATLVSEGGFNVNAGAVQLLNGTKADSEITSARLVLTLTAADLAKLDNVGVYVSRTAGANANGVKKSTTTVNTSVNADGIVVEAADGTYYVLVEISNIPQDNFGTTIYVRPFVTVDDAEYLGAEVSFSVNGILNPKA